MVWRWQQRFAEEGVDELLRDTTRKPGKAPIPAETVVFSLFVAAAALVVPPAALTVRRRPARAVTG